VFVSATWGKFQWAELPIEINKIACFSIGHLLCYNTSKVILSGSYDFIRRVLFP
jgi:hypothetical protein